jgi:hypothetical protein
MAPFLFPKSSSIPPIFDRSGLSMRYDSRILTARIMRTFRRNAAPGCSSVAAVMNVHGWPGKQDQGIGVTVEVNGRDELLASLVPTAVEMAATARNSHAQKLRKRGMICPKFTEKPVTGFNRRPATGKQNPDKSFIWRVF